MNWKVKVSVSTPEGEHEDIILNPVYTAHNDIQLAMHIAVAKVMKENKHRFLRIDDIATWRQR